MGFFVSGMMVRFGQGYFMRFICILSFITITNASQVTFIVDMSEETVVAGEGNYPGVEPRINYMILMAILLVGSQLRSLIFPMREI